MQHSMPVLACTDPNTDIGKVITEGNFGWWCESDIPEHFTQTVEIALKSDLKKFGENSFEYLKNNYDVQNSFEIIFKNINAQ